MKPTNDNNTYNKRYMIFGIIFFCMILFPIFGYIRTLDVKSGHTEPNVMVRGGKNNPHNRLNCTLCRAIKSIIKTNKGSNYGN